MSTILVSTQGDNKRELSGVFIAVKVYERTRAKDPTG